MIRNLMIIVVLCLIVLTGCSDKTKQSTGTDAGNSTSISESTYEQIDSYDQIDSQEISIIEFIGKTIDDVENDIEVKHIQATPILTLEEAIDSFFVSRFDFFEFIPKRNTYPVHVASLINRGQCICDAWLLTMEDRIYALYGLASTKQEHALIISDFLETFLPDWCEELSSPDIVQLEDDLYRVLLNYNDFCLEIRALRTNTNLDSWMSWVPFEFIIYEIEQPGENNVVDNEMEWNYYDFAPIPFTMSEFSSYYVDNSWYDNGIFSSYMNIKHPDDEWFYRGSFNCKMPINPYGYTGFQIYLQESKEAGRVYTYLVPIGYTAVPEVYIFDEISASMKLVFTNGTVLE